MAPQFSSTPTDPVRRHSSKSSTSSTISLELGGGSWLGLVATIALLDMDPMLVFEPSTYFDPAFLAVWIGSSLVIGLILGVAILAVTVLVSVFLAIILSPFH